MTTVKAAYRRSLIVGPRRLAGVVERDLAAVEVPKLGPRAIAVSTAPEGAEAVVEWIGMLGFVAPITRHKRNIRNIRNTY